MSGGVGIKQWKPYPAYKDSGVEWLGQVPEGWESTAIKYFFPVLQSGVSVNAEPGSAKDDELGVLKTSCVYGNKFTPEENKRVYDSEVGRLSCPVTKGSIIISRMNTPELVGNCGYVAMDYPNIFLPDRLWLANFTQQEQVCARFVWYLLISKYIVSLTGVLATGTSGSMKNLSQDKFLAIQITIPPLQEQQSIAAFLDHECARIDALIEKKRRLLELLEQKRRAVITHVVTRGLDPNAPMKDSGVEWLGQVPEGWTVISLRRLFHVKSGDMTSASEFIDEGYQVYGGNGFRGFIDKWNTQEGTIIIGRYGALCGNIKIAPCNLWATEHAFRVLPFLEYNTSFMAYLLENLNLNRLSARAAQPGLNSELVRNHMVSVPNVFEQQAIADHLDAATAAIDAQRQAHEKSIALLQEYRASLITHAVTGKIDVRHYAPQQ